MASIQIYIDDQNTSPVNKSTSHKSKLLNTLHTPNVSTKGKIGRIALTPARSHNIKHAGFTKSRLEKNSSNLLKSSLTRKLDENDNLKINQQCEKDAAAVKKQDNEEEENFENLPIDIVTRVYNDENLKLGKTSFLELPVLASPTIQSPINLEKENSSNLNFSLNDSLVDENTDTKNLPRPLDKHSNQYLLENFNNLEEHDFPEIDVCSKRSLENDLKLPIKEFLDLDIVEDEEENVDHLECSGSELDLGYEELGTFDIEF